MARRVGESEVQASAQASRGGEDQRAAERGRRPAPYRLMPAQVVAEEAEEDHTDEDCEHGQHPVNPRAVAMSSVVSEHLGSTRTALQAVVACEERDKQQNEEGGARKWCKLLDHQRSPSRSEMGDRLRRHS